MKKILAGGLFLVLFSGCLVPGAPLYYHYHSKVIPQRDSAEVVSYPGKHMAYQYFAPTADSVLVLDLLTASYQKMERDTFCWVYRQRASAEKLISKNHLLYFKKYKAGIMQYDTLQLIKPKWWGKKFWDAGDNAKP